MLFLFHRKKPYIVNPVLNNQYIKNIIKDAEYKNKKNALFGEKSPKVYVHDHNNLVTSSIFFLSLTTIIYYFYSNKN